MSRDKQNIKTTDWLIRSIAKEQLEQQKREAIEQAEAELHYKKIEEMAMSICENTAISCYETAWEIAEHLINEKDYRKSTDLADEIFGEIEVLIVKRMIPDVARIDDRIITDIAKLKKKYTEDTK